MTFGNSVFIKNNSSHWHKIISILSKELETTLSEEEWHDLYADGVSHSQSLSSRAKTILLILVSSMPSTVPDMK